MLNIIKNITGCDSTGNYHLNCPFCEDFKQHLYLKIINKNTAIYQCWKCGREGFLSNNKNLIILNKIITYNKKNKPVKKYYKAEEIQEQQHVKRYNIQKLIKYFVDNRNYEITTAIKIIEKYKIFMTDDKIFFTCNNKKKLMFQFYKDIDSGLYMNNKGSKFIFNFNCIYSMKYNYIVIVEGVFDALRLVSLGVPAIALLGKNFGNSFIYFCKEINNKIIYIMLDSDIKNNEDTKLKFKLQRAGKKAKIIKIKSGDPDEYFKEEKQTQQLKTILNSTADKSSIQKI